MKKKISVFDLVGIYRLGEKRLENVDFETISAAIVISPIVMLNIIWTFLIAKPLWYILCFIVGWFLRD